MSLSSTLSKEINEKKQTIKTTSKAIDVNSLVQTASNVIAPLWPISTFTARHPWMGLEGQTFEQVADWLKDTQGVDLYPSPSMILSAKKRHEIDESLLDKALQHFLDSHHFNIPRDLAERYCRASLELDVLPSHLLSSPDLKEMVDDIAIDLFDVNTMKPLSFYIKNPSKETLETTLNHHVIKWCKLYLDDSQTGWAMPNRNEGFYRSWHRLIQHDPALNKSQRKRVKNWPNDATKALEAALSTLKIPQSGRLKYLEGHLLSLPGWAGMMLWRSQNSKLAHEHLLLTEYLAVRLSMEWMLVKPYFPLPEIDFEKKIPITPLLASWIHWGGLTIKEWSRLSATQKNDYLAFAHHFNEKLRQRLWLEAWEQTYIEQLSSKIQSKQQSKHQAKPALAQLAFCIDVRSEPFRRHLENEGPFETIGIAGFFGLPIATSELGSRHSHPSLPVILKPQHRVKESSQEHELKQYQERQQTVASVSYTFKKMKQNVLASLLLPEISGPILSLQMLVRSFIPRKSGRFLRHLRDSWLRKPETELPLSQFPDTESEIPIGFSEEEKVNYARQTLEMMGLTENFSPLVVICGHGSQSTNNPYSAALECGACGGAAGGFNARVFATLCNLPEVRHGLSTEGIHIPEETVFAAAEHKTTVDELQWIYVPKLSKQAQEAFNHILSVLPKVSHMANEERVSQLPNIISKLKNPKAEAYRFAEDWSEIRPEWGLARNAAFIIGQRQITQEINLDGRVFLHNYDWKQDLNGNVLANIIAGPGTVAQWINLQYYASTVAPHYYGSGNKATQTVTSGLGVMQGTSSDLLTGLPWQSVMTSDYEAYHAPLRLLIVIQAPKNYVERLLNKDSAFRQKVENGWVRLASINSDGHWKNW